MAGITIIGMGGRFAGAPDVASFWRNLEVDVESISRFFPSGLEIRGSDEMHEVRV